MSKRVLVAIADGSEEIEAVCIIDVLRRAELDVTVASVGELQITAGRGVRIVADARIADCSKKDYDMVVLPGGMGGAENLRDSKYLTEILKAQVLAGKYYAAICAAPAVVLAHHGLLKGRKATCYPSMIKRLSGNEKAGQRVVVDGNCITSQGPGTALEFSIKLVEILCGKAKALQIAEAMLII